MTLEKLAKVLHVDEVQLMHGPKGVAAYVRIEKAWHSMTIDNEVLGERRLEVIANHLLHLADAHIPRVRDVVHKGLAAVDSATQAALQAEAGAARRRMLSWDDVGGFVNPSDGIPLQQVQRSTPSVPYASPPPAVVPDVPSAEPMPSRLHAVMAELADL